MRSSTRRSTRRKWPPPSSKHSASIPMPSRRYSRSTRCLSSAWNDEPVRGYTRELERKSPATGQDRGGKMMTLRDLKPLTASELRHVAGYGHVIVDECQCVGGPVCPRP